MCSCNIVKDEGPYVMVTDSYTASTCTTGLYSSATMEGLKKTTDFLKDNEKLKPALRPLTPRSRLSPWTLVSPGRVPSPELTPRLFTPIDLCLTDFAGVDKRPHTCLG